MNQHKIKCYIIFVINVLILCIVTACDHTYSPEEQLKLYGSGVVLVVNEQHYSISYNGDAFFWFSNYSDEGEIEGLTDQEDSVITIVTMGTGFFVSKDGKIVTTNQVINPKFNDKSITQNKSAILKKLHRIIITEISNYNDTLDILHNRISNIKNYSEYTELMGQMSYFVNKRNKFNKYSNLLFQTPSIFTINRCSQLSVSYQRAKPTEIRGLVSCKILDSDPIHNLALIQLNNDITPAHCYIFPITTKDIDTNNNQVLYLIGFAIESGNLTTINNTKAQITTGTIIQNTDSIKITFNSPFLQCSSGSPILNDKGQLVAINKTGINASQTFNYGIKVKYLPTSWIIM